MAVDAARKSNRKEGVCMNEDFVWFKEHYEEFQKTYGNAFLVIKNKKVIGVYESYGQAVRETEKTEPIGTFIVQECSQSHAAYQCCIASMNFS